MAPVNTKAPLESVTDSSRKTRLRTSDGTPLAAGSAAAARWCAGGWRGSTSRWTGRQARRWMRGIDQQRAAPAHGDVERARQRPEHGRGEAADDGQHGDRAPRARSRDLRERNAGRRAERQGGGDAQRRPAQEIAHQPLAEGERGERDGIEHRARRHEGARAGAVDQPADLRRQQRADAEHHRDAAEHDLARQAERRPGYGGPAPRASGRWCPSPRSA